MAAQMIGDVAIAISVILAVSLAANASRLNAATAALILHLAVLSLAAWKRFPAGIAASIVATGSFSFFLHPTGSWRVDDPSNWIALVSFLIASTVASRLVSQARRQAAVAESRRQELAALYRLSVELFTSSTEKGRGADAALTLVLAAIHARGGGLMVVEDDEVIRAEVWSGEGAERSEAPCREVVRRGEVVEIQGAGPLRTICIPHGQRVAVERIFVAVDTSATMRAVESVGALLWLAIEHERALAASAHAEALKESHQLKTSLLRAVSHDLNTPLTAVTLELEALQRELAGDAKVLTRLTALREDAALLRRRIENLLAMARLEAGAVVPRPEPVAAPDLFLGVREHMKIAAPDRQLQLNVAEDCPDADADPSLLLEILVNLADNAHRASPPGETVQLQASAAGGRVRFEVADRGGGLPFAGELADGEPIPLHDLPSRGLGLEIARTFAAASNGALVLMRREGGGTVARVEIPAWTR